MLKNQAFQTHKKQKAHTNFVAKRHVLLFIALLTIVSIENLHNLYLSR